MIESLLAAAAGALVGAYFGEKAASREARKAAALQVMQRVEDRLSVLRLYSVSAAQADALQFYCGECTTLSSGAAAYLDYLSALEFTLYCIDRDLIVAADVNFWLRGILQPNAHDREFILHLRTAAGDPAALEYLCKKLNAIQPPRVGAVSNGR